ncbi:hypothetical protein GZL_03363 [Streptomyces sp. 769]|nr:hypothetical protein GZL_03363 [Streptomyces sp. 769]
MRAVGASGRPHSPGSGGSPQPSRLVRCPAADDGTRRATEP